MQTQDSVQREVPQKSHGLVQPGVGVGRRLNNTRHLKGGNFGNNDLGLAD